MKYTIKRNNNIIAQVVPQGNVSTKIMGEELVNMTFELSTMVKFQIGDMVNVYGANYYLLQAPVVEKVNTKHFKYSLQFGSIIYELSKIQLLFPDTDNNLTVSDGNPIGNADLLIGHVLNNANRLQNGWTKGTVIETEAKQVDFSEDNCLSALAKIAEAFEVEYWIDADKSIHIVERKSDSGYSFQYGKNKGLKSITRNPLDGSNIVTRLYASGSEKNIGAKYRNGAKRLKMDVPYLEKNTDIYNVIEHTKKFDEVYPKRIGTVTAVDANNPLIFTDSTMDFDLNERDGNGTTILIQGVPAKVTFQTGQLAGYMLEIKENGYHTATKTFTLNKNKDEKAIEVPNNLMRPKVGDQYIITDIVMPASYVTNAEAELKVKAQEYLDKNCKERLQYTVVSDPFYFRELNVNIALGNTVHFIDADLGLDANLRILSISKDLQNPYKVSFEIGEDATIISIVRAYIEKEKQQTAIIKEQKYNAQLARRSYAMAREEFDKYFDNSGYLDPIRIKPESIETGMLMVGTRSQQLSLPDVVITVGADNTSLKNTAGQLVHLTVDPKAPRTWQIAANTQYGLSTNFNYLYVKADKKGSNATLMATEVKLLLDSDPVFYYFLIGSVSSIIEGFRRVKVNAGYTSVAPGEITTGRISSADGSNWIDLLQDRIEINARVRFAPGSQAQNYVDNLFNTANQNTKDAINNLNIGGRNLIELSDNPYGKSPGRFGTDNGSVFQNFQNGFLMINTVQNGSGYFRIPAGIITPGKEYTLSVETFGSTPFKLGVGWNNAKEFNSPTDGEPMGGDWFRVYFTFKAVQPDYWVITLVNMGGVNFSTAFRNFKLEEGNKVTTWTPAPEDIKAEIDTANQNAQNAQNAANIANQEAIAAKKILSDIANDNIVTSQEKPDLLQRWRGIESEHTRLKAQAATYNINTDNYNNYYVALANYLTNSGVFLDMSVSTNVDGREFNNNFNNYLDVRNDLYKSITDAAKIYASGLVNNLQIGGRNLLQRAANIVMSGNDHQNSDNSVPGEITVLRPGKWNCYSWLALPPVYDKVDKQLTMSLELFVDRQINFGVGVHFAYEQSLIRKDVSYITPGKWTKVFITCDKVIGANTSLIGLDGIDAPVGTKIKYRNFKLEEGNKATDWTLAPEDIQTDINNAQNSANQANNSIASLGVLAWKNAVDKAMLDDTIIEGGYIKTTLINAQAIVIGGGGVTSPDLSSALNNIKIGGRNLVELSDNPYGRSPEKFGSDNGSIFQNFQNGFLMISTVQNGSGYFRISDGIITPGKEYTLSVEAFGSTPFRIGIGWSQTKEFASPQIGEPMGGDWFKLSYTFKAIQPDYWVITMINIGAANFSTGFRNFKLEEGNKATTWTSAPEDINKNIDVVNQNAQNAQNSANNAQSSANNAQNSANNAQNSANSAINAANGLQNQVNGLTEDVKNKVLAASYASGKCLYRDTVFSKGTTNGISVYNNSGSASVRIFLYYGDRYGAPTNSNSIAVIQYNGDGNVTPYLGGFTFSTPTRSGAIFVTRFIAKIEVGYEITFHSNPIGDGGSSQWITSNKGTGKWEEYIYLVRCGTSGAFSSTNFFAINGANKNLEWYLCYASVFDLTDAEKDIYSAVENIQTSLNDVKTKTDNFTSIQGGLIMSNIMSVGSTQMQQNAFLSGVTDNGALSIRIGAGANYANKDAAPFRVLDNGKMFASDAEITGVINANSGRIGQFNIQGSSLIASSTGQPDNSWAPWSSFAMITPEMVMFRTNGANTDSVKEAGFGITQSAGTGSDGAMGFIKHNIQNYGGTNIGLRVQAKNATENIALDILDGDIRVKGQKGYTGQWRGFWVQNGLIVSVY
ncbi:phage tail protein [Elizabethkingia anophelis]|uniref:phage tail protein n=1 Tax=Elizabethkingia anophelis TaxID=1117645 RepID=UPI0038920152